jgi:acetyl-CoA carboxylase carboxyltransferase component
VPRDPRKPYSMKRVIEMIVDRGSMFEIQGTYGRSAITSLAG